MGRKTAKILTTTLLLTLLTATATAAQLQSKNGDNTVWLNQDAENIEEFTYSCQDNYEVQKVFIEQDDSESNLLNDQDQIKNDQFHQTLSPGEGGEPSYGLNNLTLSCYNQTNDEWNNASTDVFLDKLTLKGGELEKHGKGFVGGRLKKDENTGYGDRESISFSFKRKSDSAVTNLIDDWGSDNFDFENILSITSGSVDISSKKVKLSPQVNSFTSDTLDLSVYNQEGIKIRRIEVNPEIYKWDADPVSGWYPERKITFDQIRGGKYSYNLDVLWKGQEPEEKELIKNNIRLTVEKQALNENNKLVDYNDVDQEGLDKIEDELWLKLVEPSGPGNYQAVLNSEGMKQLGKLNDGTYRFTLELKDTNIYERGNGLNGFIIDRLLVEKGSKFSGVVSDSDGGGVNTQMIFSNDNSDVTVNTGSDGFYSKEIDDQTFDSGLLKFFDRGQASPDATLNVQGPEIKKNSDLGPGDSAIKFDYFSDPSVGLAGVSPVSMAAVKFGYNVQSGDSIKVGFNPANIDPENLQVYECDRWNFQSQECLSSWNQTDSNDVSVNYATWEANIQSLSTYKIPSSDDTILLNAYLLGTTADIGLKDTLTIDGPVNGRIKEEGQLTVSGGVLDENGNNVPSIPVEVNFESDDNSVTIDATTDENGDFEATGKAPSKPGNYTVSVTSDPESFGSLETTFESPLEVYTNKDISVSASRQVQLTKGVQKEVDVDVENTGQADLNNVELSLSGLNSEFYGLQSTSIGSISPGKTRTVPLTIDLPSTFQGSYPSITVSAEGRSDGSRVSDSAEIQIQANQGTTTSPSESQNETSDEDTESESVANQTGETLEDNDDDAGSLFSPVSNSINATGDFVQSQSSINLALGLVMVLMMTFAAAITKNKDDGGDRRGRMGRGRSGGMAAGQVKNVSPGNKSQQEDSSQKTEFANRSTQSETEGNHEDNPVGEDKAVEKDIKEQSQDSGSDEQLEDDDSENESEAVEDSSDAESEEGKFVCEETGKEFDTKDALEMHKKIKGLD